MKARQRIRFLFIGVVGALLGQFACAQSNESPPFALFTGDAGYQEIRLANDSWYVAYHGTRKHAIAAVNAAWMARAGQLCESIGKRFVVELRYVGQQVFPSDPVASIEDYLAIKVAGPVYIPLFLPSGPRVFGQNLTPTKAAAVRCVDQNTGLVANLNAISSLEAKDGARKVGIAVQ